MRIRPFTVLALATSMLTAQQPAGATPKEPQPAAPAFDAGQWNSAVGLGGGAGGIYGDRVRKIADREPAVAESIAAGLDWLKRAQSDDGRWSVGDDADVNVAVTSLAVLAMLGNGNTMRTGPHKNPIKTGVRWLREIQSEAGAFATKTGPHMLATLAMTETFHLSNYTLLKPTAARGLAHLATLVHEDGGWRADATAGSSDPALTLWGMSVLGTASTANMLPADTTYDAVAEWLRGPLANQIATTSVLGVAAPGPRQPELAFDQQMANAFTLCWLEDPDAKSPAFERARKVPREWAAAPGRKLSIHEWYCSSNALAQAGDLDAVAAIATSLVEAQVTTGDDAGSWQPIGALGEVGGRAWTTAMAVLTLEAPSRYRRDLASWVAIQKRPWGK